MSGETDLRVVEGQAFEPESHTVKLIQHALREVQRDLQTTVPPLVESGRLLTIDGIVGDVSLGSRRLTIEPKVDAHSAWIESVAYMVTLGARVHVGLTVGASPAPSRGLTDALAKLYAAALAEAMRADGPILVVRRTSSDGFRLRGKLDITRWTRRAAVNPISFPTSFDELTTDNSYSRALSRACLILSNSTSDTRLRSRLLSLAAQVRPDRAGDAVVHEPIAHLRLPSQFAKYRTSWTLARAVLSRRTPTRGNLDRLGITIAVEPWRLLETLLWAALGRLVTQQPRETDERELLARAPWQRRYLLARSETADASDKYVRPDGLLIRDGTPIAAFEAKYTKRQRNWPPPHHMYQAMVAASTLGCKTSTLVYPELFTPSQWRLEGTSEPAVLQALGVGLYSTRGPEDLDNLARRLAACVDSGAGFGQDEETSA